MEPLEKENERLSAEVRLLSRYVRSAKEVADFTNGTQKSDDCAHAHQEWAKKADECAHQLYLRKCRETELLVEKIEQQLVLYKQSE